MAVMQIGAVGVCVDERVVAVPMRVRLARRIVRRVRVAMVLVVDVAVLVLHRLVHVAMRVPLPHE
jgi:hypothetical protein